MGMTTPPPQQLVSHWCKGVREEDPHGASHLGAWAWRYWVGGASFIGSMRKDTFIFHLFKVPNKSQLRHQ